MFLFNMPKELQFICQLEALLKEKGWTYSELHRQSGASMTTIRSLTREGSLERIDRSSTEKILQALDCSFDDLWKVKWLESNE